MASHAQRQKRTSIRNERIFFLSMAAAIFILVIWGFARSFYLRTVMAPPPTWIDDAGFTSWLFIGHGLLFTMWLGLFSVQVVLIGSRRLPLHKQVGQAAWPLYFAVVAMGLAVGWFGAAYGFHGVPFDSVTFSALPWLVILSFAILAGLGLRERRDPQRHKRLMLLGTLAMADAGIARVTLFHPLLPEWLSMTVLLVIPVILWDLATIRRVHPATILGGSLIVISLIVSIPIGRSAAWHMLITDGLGIAPVAPAPAS